MAGGYRTFNESFEDNPPSYGSINPRVSITGGSSTEYFQLCDKITTNIFTINNATTNLERMGRIIGSAHDSQIIRDRISQLSADTISYIAETTNLLKSVLLLLQGDKRRKVRVRRLQTEFQSSAERFSQLQKKVVTTFSNARLPMDMVKHSDDTTSEVIRSGEEDLVRKRELLNFEYELAMQEERQQRVQALERDMTDINDIMKELSTMTAEQGEIINNIEDNVENTAVQVEAGGSELVKAVRYQNKHRKCCCIIILITILVLIISGIIIAIHYSNPN